MNRWSKLWQLPLTQKIKPEVWRDRHGPHDPIAKNAFSVFLFFFNKVLSQGGINLIVIFNDLRVLGHPDVCRGVIGMLNISSLANIVGLFGDEVKVTLPGWKRQGRIFERTQFEQIL